MKANPLILLPLAATLLLSACQQDPREALLAPPTTDHTAFEVKGRLKSIATDRQSAVIEHETIPDYMPAMTMPFYVRQPSELDGLNRGDALLFRFVITDDNSWIENIRQLPDEAIAESPANERAKRTRISNIIPALDTGDVVPNFRLTSQESERFQLSDFAGRQILLTFIFVRCPVPNFCPLMSENFRKLQTMINETGYSSQVQLLSITIDPEFDTPEILKLYASRYSAGSNWTFATGSQGEIDELTARFSVYVEPESGTITHGLATALISPGGILRQVWRGNDWTPAEVFEALKLPFPENNLPGSASAENFENLGKS